MREVFCSEFTSSEEVTCAKTPQYVCSVWFDPLLTSAAWCNLRQRAANRGLKVVIGVLLLRARREILWY